MDIFNRLGAESGCKLLAAEFYSRVATNPVLRPLFPGKSQRCAIEEFSAFLIQFLDGNEELTQYRTWLSLRESHARFRISRSQREAWMDEMEATLEASSLDDQTKLDMKQFFEGSSAYIIGEGAPDHQNGELCSRWKSQRALDDLIEALVASRDSEVLANAPAFRHRRAVFVGILRRMLKSGRKPLLDFVHHEIERDPDFGWQQNGGRTLLHFAAGSGCSPVVEQLLRFGIEADIMDFGGHTALYAVANECGNSSGPEIVRALVRAGADVNHSGGVTRATPLHMSARRGFLGIAEALLDCGASPEARDAKGDRPFERAINCRKLQLADFLNARARAAN